MKNDINYIFKRVVIFFIIFFILSLLGLKKTHAKETWSFTTIRPLQMRVGYRVENSSGGIISQGDNAFTITEENINNSTYYFVNGKYNDSGAKITKITLQYDLSNVNSDYVIFTMYDKLIPIQPNATLSGRNCQITGSWIGLVTSSNATIPTGTYTLICPNPKSASAWVDIIYNGTNTSLFYVGVARYVGTMNEESVNNITSAINQTNEKLDDLNNNITSTDTSGANTEAQNMLNAIDATDTTGLSGVITAPLIMVNRLSSGCSPITIPIPYLSQNGVVPCMSTSVYNKFPTALVTTVATVVNGFLIYRVIASLYAMIKGFRDPEDDKVEVADL